MSYETPQMYRWKDPTLPPNAPALSVYFLQEPQVNSEETAKTGVQTYDNVLIAYVAPMGMPKSNAAHEVERTLPDGTVKVNPYIAAKYGEQIKLYKAGTASEAVGTPLRDLVGMTAATAMNLKARGIHTIEMLGDMPDASGGDVMGFWELRSRAQKHMEHRKENAPAVRMDAMEAAHQKEVADLKKQIEELAAMVNTPEKRGPGRPKQEAA